MTKQNVIQEKSFSFAVQIVRFSRDLRLNKREYSLADQLLRSGTSIGANIEEALSGASRKDFVNKLAIAAKEARETRYWLRVLIGADVIASEEANKLLQACDELLRILNAIILTTRSKTARSESA